jgi:hypothetical protein
VSTGDSDAVVDLPDSTAVVVGGVNDALAIWSRFLGKSPNGTVSGRRAAAAFVIALILMEHFLSWNQGGIQLNGSTSHLFLTN